MSLTQLRGTAIADGTITRTDLNTATPGDALLRKVIAGPGIALSSTGADSGTGDVTITAAGGTTDFGMVMALSNFNFLP